MSEGRIRAMAVGVRSAMRVDWVALTAGIIGAGVAIVALMILLERDRAQPFDCVPHSDQGLAQIAVAPCTP